MRTITSITAMQRLAQSWRREGVRIGFVPTMGYLHAGHISLVRAARKAVGRAGKVVVSIYVNPTQFGPNEDFKRYPRDFARDQKLCRDAGVDIVFAPTDDRVYPAGHSTFIVEEALSQTMEGKSRPGHFRGVATVVAKLFNMVLPDVAVFGAKDYQQAAVVQRMVRDLNFPVKLIVARTLREADGVALSSRNKYLIGHLRTQAVALWVAIQTAKALVKRKRKVDAAAFKAELTEQIQKQPDARVDYIEFFDPLTLEPERQVARGTHMALAVWVGQTRLIDNARL
jgi:pantoate--beta-alanine ligase